MYLKEILNRDVQNKKSKGSYNQHWGYVNSDNASDRVGKRLIIRHCSRQTTIQ